MIIYIPKHDLFFEGGIRSGSIKHSFSIYIHMSEFKVAEWALYSALYFAVVTLLTGFHDLFNNNSKSNICCWNI